MTDELDFPNTPAVGDVFEAPNDADYKWASNRWVVQGRAATDGGGGEATDNLDIAMWYQGIPVSNEVLLRFVVVRPFWFPESKPCGLAVAMAPPVNSGYPTGLSVCRNGTTMGDSVLHMVWGFTGDPVGVWSPWAEEFSHFVPGDVLIFQLVHQYSAAEGATSPVGDISITLTATLE